MIRKSILTTLLSSAVIAAVLVIAATATWAAEPAFFDHSPHLEEGLGCDACHASEGGELPKLKTGGCTDCHDEGAPPAKMKARSRRLKAKFPHAQHAGSLECRDCHGGVITGKVQGDAPDAMVTVARCVGCHAESGVEIAADACGRCHGGDPRKEEPSSHAPGWRKQHGPWSETPGAKAHGQSCAQCHGSDACLKCHQQRRPMSHRLHIEERDAECSGCHPGAKDARKPSADQSYCADCHDGPVQADRIVAPAQRLKVRFPHRPHAQRVACDRCHARTVADAQPRAVALMTSETCTTCHEQMGAPVPEGRCVACHEGAQRKVSPADHTPSWIALHGRASQKREFGAGHGQECSQCHEASACRNCHATQRPRSHTGLWRVRSHGQAAMWDRDACRTCHETGTCIGCHRRTAPLNHIGAWGLTHGLAAQVRSNERCMVCHERAWCVACHQGGAR